MEEQIHRLVGKHAAEASVTIPTLSCDAHHETLRTTATAQIWYSIPGISVMRPCDSGEEEGQYSGDKDEDEDKDEGSESRQAFQQR